MTLRIGDVAPDFQAETTEGPIRRQPANPRQTMNDMTTKKAKAKPIQREMRSEYRFDYSRSRPNRFASRMTENTVAVVLEPDVASAFKTYAAVNRALRNALKSRAVAKKKAGQADGAA